MILAFLISADARHDLRELEQIVLLLRVSSS
jgi:hypothetical protein